VHDSFLVRRVERVRDLAGNEQRLFERQSRHLGVHDPLPLRALLDRRLAGWRRVRASERRSQRLATLGGSRR
jgi:hypothetical protein